MRQVPVVIQLALLACLGAVAYLSLQVWRLQRLVLPAEEGVPMQPLVMPRGDLSAAERSVVELFREASSAVVHITTIRQQADPLRMRVLEVPTGTGSGFFWDRLGHVVTNLHVISGAEGAQVQLPDQSVWRARRVGVSRRHDLAVLRIAGAAHLAKPLPLGESRDLAVGQMVAAIGSPFGLDYTLSTGIVSGLGREIPGQTGLPIRDVIQTDAAINPGNSGGPLLDSSGRLIGVNTAILSPSGASAGIGFAVPVDTVARVVPQLIRYGREVRPVLGVQLAHDAVARRLGLPGPLILQVQPGSPAAAAGLRETVRDRNGRIRLGDVVVAVGDKRVQQSEDVYAALDNHEPGDEITLQLLRDGEPIQVGVKLAANVDL